jgi:predicted membrane chloride channel (bestrophin family)
MNKYLTIINYRTLIALTIVIISIFLVYKYDLFYNIDLTFLSIAIIFPLVFNIRGSFRRREKALEHLSQFRSSLKTVYYFFESNSKLSVEDKKEVHDLLIEISNKVMIHLRNSSYKTKEIDDSIHQVFEFIIEKEEFIPGRLKDKIIRFLNELHESVENLHAIHVHRTPISLKAYCEYFIYIFPLIYTPAIVYKIGIDSPKWITFFIVMISEFMLISLYNIQDQMEYPFDNIGLDDINLDIFKMDR